MVPLLDEQVYTGEDRYTRGGRAMESQERYLREDGLAGDEDVLKGKRLLTYGEFPIPSFSRLLFAEAVMGRPLNHDDVFVDLGSGVGRLVLAAAMLHPFRYCAGVEVLPELHAEALEAHRRARRAVERREGGTQPRLELRPCEFVCQDFMEGAAPSGPDPLSEASIVYAYSTTWRSDNGFHLSPGVSAALAARVRRDVVVITTDKVLPPEGEFEVFGRLEVDNWEVGGDSMCWYHRLKPS